MLTPRVWLLAMALVLLSFVVHAQEIDPNADVIPEEARERTTEATDGSTAAAANDVEAAVPLVQEARPFNAFERFSYESGISNQLQSLMGRYINPSLFHVSVQVEGRLVYEPGTGATGGASVTGEATGRPVETFGDDKTLEMLPALPFFSSRLRAPVRVEEAETTTTRGTGSRRQEVPMETAGPHIDRIRVYFMTDTMIKAESNSFYRNLISSALRLDPSRGDDIVMSTTAFPREAVEATVGQAAAGPPINVNATLNQPPAQAEADNRMAEVVSAMGNELALLIGAGLAIIGILIFVGLVWHARKSSESAAAAVAATKAATSSSRAAAGGEGGGGEQSYSGGPPQMARMQIQAEMASHDPQQAQLKESDPLMDWLINDRENLAFTLERWIRDQGKRVIDKTVLMLYPYGNHFFDMLTEYLEPETVAQAQVVWNGWDPDNHDTGSRLRALDELAMSMKNQKQFGNFPFIIYLKDKEILALLDDEPALNCLMVLDGLAANRKSALMDMFDAEKTTEMLSSYAELGKQKYGVYADLSSRLFLKLKGIRERGEQNEKAYESVLGTILQQSMRKQEEMVESLRQSNPDMYDWIRERITLWSDVAGLGDQVLLQALEAMESDAIASMLAGDERMQERILPLRPQREQVLIKNLLSQNGLSTQQTEEERKAFLARLPQGETAELIESKAV